MSDAWKNAIRWSKENSYTEHGCRLSGFLLVAHCTEAFMAHPKQGQFGAGCCFDVQEAAEQILKDRGIEYVRKLAIPDLVVSVSEADWEIPT